MYEIVAGDLIPKALVDQLNDEAVYKVVSDIAEGARNEWVRLAGEHLHSSRSDYIDAILPVAHRTKGIAIMTLSGAFPNMVENGGDLRDILLGDNVDVAEPGNKGKRRAKAGHYYRAIPMRQQVPGTRGSGGQAMGDPYRDVVKNSATLGRAVYGAAKLLRPGQRIPAHMRYGKGKKLVVPKLREHHKTDIYAGMQRLRGAYQKAVQSQYGTFRTISQAQPDGWIITQGAELAPMVESYIERVAPSAFQAYVEQLGKK